MGALSHNSFDRVAPYYPGIEFLVFGNALTRARYSAFDCITNRSRVLLLGEGNGRFLTELLRRYPDASVTCVEPSSEMRRSQSKRLESQFGKIPENLTTVAERFQDWSCSNAGFDIIVAHFFLDLFGEAEIGEVVAKIDRLASPNARICVAEFSEEDSILSRPLIRAMYLFFRLVSNLKTHRVPDWRREFAAKGWAVKECDARYLGLVRSSVCVKA